MRADRLLSLLMLLQTRGRLTADRLADELEVSARTIYRDVYALRVAGFPVYSERGLGGGCYLHEDYRVRLTDLTQDELAALFVMAVPLSLVDLGVGEQAKGALLKLAAALPTTRRNIQQHARQRIYLDPQSWKSSKRPAHVPTLTLLREAAWADRWVKVTFRRLGNIHSSREIAPYGLVAKETRWHVVWAGRDGRVHVDGASAVVEATLLDDSFARPEPFDLPVFWSQWALRQEGTRRAYVVRALLKQEVIPSLVYQLGQDHVVPRDAALEGDRAIYDLVFERFEHARATLLGLGAAAEVINPASLRLSMADYGRQIAAVYSAM